MRLENCRVFYAGKRFFIFEIVDTVYYGYILVKITDFVTLCLV